MSKNSAKSAASGNRKTGSPAGKASANSILPPTIAELKKQKLTLWTEWNENDINAEKWEGAGKAKDSKAKPTSAAPMSHGFEDPDPKFDWPANIYSRIDSFKRPSEIFEKTPVVVDADNGLENFDLVLPNEHLHNNETMRWIISQIHTLWDICKKDPKSYFNSNAPSQSEGDAIINKAVASGRLWRPWEHIYAVNKIVKGPFIPVYNPHGKYAVRLYFMGTWRKIIIDDLMPVDEKGNILLPQSSITGEIWPMLLSKALLKIISLDLNPSDSATEFNDVSIISCFTGWLPEPLPLRFGHISEVWKFLKETLPKYQWPDEKPKIQIEEEIPAVATELSEQKEEKSDDSKSDQKGQKGKADAKNMSGKDAKQDKNKKDPKDKKGKSIVDEPLQEENFAPEFPEMVVYASFTDLPLNKLSASTEVADRRERLRKYSLNHDFSNPCWITCTRDISLNPPPPPEKIPVWKTIRQKKKHVVPSDEPIHPIQAKPDQWIELKSPYVGYKASTSLSVLHNTRVNSRYSKIRSRPQSQNGIQGIEEIDEVDDLHEIEGSPESPTDPNKVKIMDFNASSNDILNASDASKLAKLGTGKKETEKEKALESSDIVKPPASLSSSSKEATKTKSNRENSITSEMNKAPGSKLEDDMKSIKQATSVYSANGPLFLDPNIQITEQKNISHEPDLKAQEQKNKLWMDFEDFFVCFKSIVVYHKPSCFKFNEKYSDLKQVIPQIKQQDKKKEPNATQQPLAPLFDEKSPKLLFVDSLLPIELIVSFSSLSKWYEQKLDLSEKVAKTKKSEGIIQDHDTMSVAETIREITPLQPGHLMAEPYTWKSLVSGQPLLRIHTTSIRSSFLSLPPGRHVLKFMINAPVGYHINVISNTKFSLGDEEEIMPKLTDESCRFVDQSLHIMKCLSDAIKNFNDPLKQKETLEFLYSSISPLTDAYLNSEESKKILTKKILYETFQSSLYEMLRKALTEFDQETTFAWRVFLGDALTNDPFLLKDKRPETSSTSRGSAKKVDKKKSELPTGGKESTKQSSANAVPDQIDEKLEYWKNHIPNAEEHIAAVKIQTVLRAHFVRQIFQSRKPGVPKNNMVTESLKKSLNTIELNIHENALYLFRTMFKINPAIMQYYSFYKDEWNRISYLDYNGSYPDQQPNSWLILFRDVFYANDQILLLPKIYCNLSNCLLRVINNDTYKEIPKVFNKVSPYTYAKNRKGYTIIAESRLNDQPVQGGRWRLRLIGSTPNLISPKANKTEIMSTFDSRETRDYYMPNENKTIMRYKIVVTDDHMLTLQLSTSKSDVYIKLSIYDNGEEITSVSGKGTAILPAFMFQKDRGDNSPLHDQSAVINSSRPGSKTYSISQKKSIINQSAELKQKTKRSSSQSSFDAKEPKTINSRSSSRQSLGVDLDDEEQNKSHKYILEAVVLKNSWPLSPSQWAFVNTLRENEMNDLKVFSKDRAGSPTKESKQNIDKAAAQKAAAAAAKSKPQKGKGSTPAASVASRPASSVAFDTSKPHWTLKWVSDDATAGAIDIKKDTDRIEEIKALKKAWENVEAGRSAKAMVARSTFLKSNLVKADGSLTDDDVEKLNEDEQQQPLADPNSISQTSASNLKGIESATSKKGKPEDQKQTAKQSVAKPKDKKDKDIQVKSSQDISTQDQVNNELVAAVDEILLSRPPTPPKPKVFLPPIDVGPFLRSTNNQVIIKDEEFAKEQEKHRKAEINEFLGFKEQMLKFREEEKKYRLYQKLKQIEECENLQGKLDAARKYIIEPREAFRQIFLDAERKRLEELATQEASLSMKQPDPKDKKKGSAGKKKK